MSGDTFELSEWFDKNVDRLTNLTNEQISDRLGYTRPNIISMWRTGRTRIPLDKLPALAEILGVELVSLLPMWLEQYVGSEGYPAIMKAAARLASEDEAKLLEAVRKVTKGRRFKVKATTAKLNEILDFD